MKTLSRTRRTGTEGFTLIEISIASGILAVVIGSITMMALASDRAFQTGTTVAHLEARASGAMALIVQELSIAQHPAAIGPDGDTIDYFQAVDFIAGEPELTLPRRLAFEYEAGELDDGVDNNGNGLVDEGQVILTTDVGAATERRRVLTRWVPEMLAGELENGVDDNGNGLVDEPGFTMVQAGETITVRLTLQRVNSGGLSMSRSSVTSTRLRN
jgi:hypothetical protein